MPPALIPARMVANSRSVQRAISGSPSSSTRTNQKTCFLFPASTKNGILRSAQYSTASSQLSKRRTSASYRGVPFERYADDIVVHCSRMSDATRLKNRLSERFSEVGLVLNAGKTVTIAPFVTNCTENVCRVCQMQQCDSERLDRVLRKVLVQKLQLSTVECNAVTSAQVDAV